MFPNIIASSVALGLSRPLCIGTGGKGGEDLYVNNTDELDALLLANGVDEADIVATTDAIWPVLIDPFAGVEYASFEAFDDQIYGVGNAVVPYGIPKTDIIAAIPSTPSIIVTELDGVTPSSSHISAVLNAAGSTEGALLLACIVLRSIGSIPSAPAGWSLVAVQDDGDFSAEPITYVFSRIAAASETAYTFVYASAEYDAASLIQVQGAATVDNITSSPDSVLPAVLLSSSGVFIAVAGQSDIPATTMTPPAGYVQVSDRTGGGRSGVGVAYKISGASTSNGTDSYVGAENNIHLTAL